MQILVLDSAAFIKQFSLNQFQDKIFYTTYNVVAEIKDANAKEFLANNLHQIKQGQPDQQHIDAVKKFATLTGDLNQLSETDIEIIALAYSLMEKNGKKNQVNFSLGNIEEYKSLKNQYPNQKQDESIQEEQQKEEDDEGWIEVTDKHSKKHEQTKVVAQQVKQDQKQPEESQIQQNESSSDDDANWIDEANVDDHFNSTKTDTLLQQSFVSVITSDYAMQNVLLQMKISVISIEGKFINKTKRWVLECHICKAITRDQQKLFCPTCGNNSLLRVSCSIGLDGVMTLYRKKNFQLNMRGFQYSIPKDNKLILREDQLQMKGVQIRLEKQRKEDERKFKNQVENYENGWTFDDIKHLQKKSQKVKIGYGHVNPNDREQIRKYKNK